MERSLRSPKEIFSQAKRQEVAEISWQSQAAKPQRFLDFARNDKEGRCRNDKEGRCRNDKEGLREYRYNIV